MICGICSISIVVQRGFCESLQKGFAQVEAVGEKPFAGNDWTKLPTRRRQGDRILELRTRQACRGADIAMIDRVVERLHPAKQQGDDLRAEIDDLAPQPRGRFGDGWLDDIARGVGKIARRVGLLFMKCDDPPLAVLLDDAAFPRRVGLEGHHRHDDIAASRCVAPRESAGVEDAEIVRMCEEHGPRSEQGRVFQQRAGGTEQRRLVIEDDLIGIVAGLHIVRHKVGVVMGVDDDAFETRGHQLIEPDTEQRPAADRHETFG